MRPSNKSRSRKSGGNNPNNQRRNVGNVMNRVYDSAGPDGKVRGTPQQIIDKYQALARDAQLAGDRVIAENYLQHSEHYSRLLGEALRQQNEQRASQQNDRDDSQNNDSPNNDSQNRGPRPNDHDQQARNQYGGDRSGERDANGGSALATFDPTGEEEAAGPIETPEGRSEHPGPDRSRDDEVRSQPTPNGASHAESGGGGAPQPVKRPRTRRKAKPADEDVAAQAD